MKNSASNPEVELVAAHVDRTELRIYQRYQSPRIWLLDEGTEKVLLKRREEPDFPALRDEAE